MNATVDPTGRQYDAGMQILSSQRKSAAEALEAAIEAWGGSVSSLARHAGVSPSTITRFLKDPGTVPVPKKVTIDKILGVVSPNGSPKQEAALDRRDDVFSVEIAGEIRAGVWVEGPDDIDFGPPVVVSIPSHLVRSTLVGYRCGTDEATGGRWPAGTVLIIDSAFQITNGQEAVFQRVKGDLVETTYRIYRADNARSWTLTPPRTSGGEWAEKPWRNPQSASQPSDGATEVLAGPVIAAVWCAPS